MAAAAAGSAKAVEERPSALAGAQIRCQPPRTSPSAALLEALDIVLKHEAFSPYGPPVFLPLPRRDLRFVCKSIKAIVDGQISSINFVNKQLIHYAEKCYYPALEKVVIRPGEEHKHAILPALRKFAATNHPSLHSLVMYRVGPKAIEALAQANWTQLKSISLHLDAFELISPQKFTKAVRSLQKATWQLEELLVLPCITANCENYVPESLPGPAVVHLARIFTSLRKLQICTEFTFEHAQKLAKLKMPELEELDIEVYPEEGNEVEIIGVPNELVQASWPKLRSLRLANAAFYKNFSGRRRSKFAFFSCFTNLEDLSLQNCHFGGHFSSFLKDLGMCSKLRRLTFDDVDAVLLEDLGDADFPELKELHCRNLSVKAANPMHLFNSDHMAVFTAKLPKLQVLVVQYKADWSILEVIPLWQRPFQLPSSPILPSLKSLTIKRCMMSESAMTFLKVHLQRTQLERLCIYGCQMRDLAAAEIAMKFISIRQRRTWLSCIYNYNVELSDRLHAMQWPDNSDIPAFALHNTEKYGTVSGDSDLDSDLETESETESESDEEEEEESESEEEESESDDDFQIGGDMKLALVTRMVVIANKSGEVVCHLSGILSSRFSNGEF